MGKSSKSKHVHCPQRRSKRLLLLVMAFIAAGQVGMGLLLDLDPVKVRFQLAETIVSSLDKTSHHPDIVFLGSSRFMKCIVVDQLQKAMKKTFGNEAPLIVNCSFPGADPYSIDFLLQRLLSRGITPGMVVLEISPETVMLGGKFFGGQVTRILTLKEMPDAAADLIAFGKMHELLSSRAVPVYKFRRELLTCLFGVPPPYLAPATGIVQQLALNAAEGKDAPQLPDVGPQAGTNPKNRDLNNGSQQQSVPMATKVEAADHPRELPQNVSQAKEEDRLREIQSFRPDVQSWLRGFRIQGLYSRHLESMLEYFQAHGIAVILVGIPVTSVHFQCYHDGINEKFLDYMNTLVRTYGCRFIDYRNRFSDDFFFDHHHMTPEGGNEFSLVFQEEILCDAWRAYSSELQSSGHTGLKSF